MEIRIIIWRLRQLARLQLDWNHRIGRLIGRLFVWFPNRERRVSDINLALCMGELSAGERLELRNRSLLQAGCTLTELAAIWYWPIDRVMSLVRQVHGEALLRCEPGQGLIVLAPHLGCWEIAGLYLASRGEVTSLYRPPRQAQWGPIIKQARQRSGAELVPTDAAGVRRLYQTLRAGGTTGILPDQQPDSSKGAVFAPFCGVPALTMLLVNRLLLKTGAKAVFCYARRLPAGGGFDIHYLPAPAGLGARDPVAAATALNLGVEHCIRDCPDQYQWSYKRFKDQPNDARSPYDLMN